MKKKEEEVKPPIIPTFKEFMNEVLKETKPLTERIKEDKKILYDYNPLEDSKV